MIRKKAASTSESAAGKMIKAFNSKHPPAEYEIGNEVFVRRFSSKCRKKAGRKNASKSTRVVKGTIVDRNIRSGTYKVCYSLADMEVEEWFKVSDITSTTAEEEKQRHTSLANDCSKLATQPPTTVENNDHPHQPLQEKSPRSSSSTPLQTCPSTEFLTTASNPQGYTLTIILL